MRVLVLVALLLVGCSTTTVPVKQNFPEAPELLLEKCPPLETIEQEKIVLSEFLKVITRNYTKYYDCRQIVSGWHEWYEKQKRIMDSISSDK